ncbi:MAG: perosamine synthetase [Frankiaceae bacterium]|jgi:dTDP-4-amino-4,6-dideoxygalactose transaminase|nr:perosamine synthetase [Frankiaceae bacterium]
MGNAEPVRLPSDQDASGRSFGDEELALLREVLDSGVLGSIRGSVTKAFEAAASELLGAGHAVAVASGTAAVHSAIAALDPEPGEEIVTTGITDIGGIAPILYQGAIPAFADVDPRTGNVTAETVAAALSERTRAVIVTHLFGNPCDTAAIVEVAAAHGVPVIEDCAQALLSRGADGALVGTYGDIACYSLQQGKQASTGEGGLVLARDEETARRVRLYVNKAWEYGSPDPDHRSLALNYRFTELGSAVALAQLAKLPAGIAARIAAADALTAAIGDLPGITPPVVTPGATHSYWRYALLVDPAVHEGGSPTLGASLADLGVPAAARYIKKPAWRCGLFTEQKTFGTSRWPFTLARPEALDYAAERFPGTFEYLDRVLVLPWNERYTAEHAAILASAIGDAVREPVPAR